MILSKSAQHSFEFELQAAQNSFELRELFVHLLLLFQQLIFQSAAAAREPVASAEAPVDFDLGLLQAEHFLALLLV